MGIEPTSEVWDESAGNGFMPLPRGSIGEDQGVAFSGRCGPPQPILLIHKGFLMPVRKPFFFLGKTWEKKSLLTR
jgi:hypothetical protein